MWPQYLPTLPVGTLVRYTDQYDSDFVGVKDTDTTITLDGGTQVDVPRHTRVTPL